jgi:hypothetical protein
MLILNLFQSFKISSKICMKELITNYATGNFFYEFLSLNLGRFNERANHQLCHWKAFLRISKPHTILSLGKREGPMLPFLSFTQCFTKRFPI